ncbi:MAG TPA: ABC transporter permease [Aggregatilineales bacterium]|nr:ABC transporter permease [Anaerolineales bacterium]HRE49109.1 ABC transporter permease [Aggregatilineales bacterium]
MAVASSAKPVSLRQEEVKTRTPLGDAWQQFKRHKLAVLSLIFIVLLLTVSIGADFLKSVGFVDDPIFQHKGKGMSYADPMTCTQDIRRLNPQWCFVAGTDSLGRDVFSRVVYGSRVSLAVGLVGAATSMFLGVMYGLIAGYYGGQIDNLMMRFVDFMYAFPDLAFIILIQTFVKSVAAEPDKASPIFRGLIALDRSMGGLFFLFIVIGMLSWIGVARLARGQTLSAKNREYVEAARAMGAKNRRIIIFHVLPNIMGPLVVVACTAIPGFIFTEAALSYLGIGINPPTPSWGAMIQDAQTRGFGSAPHLILAPGLVFVATVLAFNFLGDGLRDALDPSLRGS